MSDTEKKVGLFKELFAGKKGEPIPTSCTKCGNLVACTCQLKQDHKPGCAFLRAAQLGVELACPHGFQACPECDACSCGLVVTGIR